MKLGSSDLPTDDSEVLQHHAVALPQLGCLLLDPSLLHQCFLSSLLFICSFAMLPTDLESLGTGQERENSGNFLEIRESQHWSTRTRDPQGQGIIIGP